MCETAGFLPTANPEEPFLCVYYGNGGAESVPQVPQDQSRADFEATGNVITYNSIGTHWEGELACRWPDGIHLLGECRQQQQRPLRHRPHFGYP